MEPNPVPVAVGPARSLVATTCDKTRLKNLMIGLSLPKSYKNERLLETIAKFISRKFLSVDIELIRHFKMATVLVTIHMVS